MKKYLWLVAIVAGLSLIIGAVASTALPLSSRFNQRLVEWRVCEPGQMLEYKESAPYTITDQDGTRVVSDISIACVAPDGTRVGGKAGATIGTLIGVYALFFFVPLLVAGVVWLWKLQQTSPHKIPSTKKS